MLNTARFERQFIRLSALILFVSLTALPTACGRLTEPQVPNPRGVDEAVKPTPVVAVAGAPIGIPDYYATPEDVTLTVDAPGLMANDLDPDGDEFIVSNFLSPSHGTLTSIVTNGAFVYEPEPGFVGTDTFVYTLRDVGGNASEPTTVTIEVVPDPNRPPLGAPDAYATPVDVTLTVPAPGLRANDLDPDGDEFIVSNFLAPSHGTLTSIVTNGAFVYEPEPGFVGTDTFVYTLQDARGAFAEPESVTIEVLPAGSGNPVGVPDAYLAFVDQTLTVAAPGLRANDLDPDGDEFIVSNFLAPSHGTLTSIVTNGAFAYEPEPGFVGTDEFTYTLRDAGGNVSGPTTVTIQVLPDPNRPPLGVPDAYATQVGVTLTVDAPGLRANDLDPDGDDIIVSNFLAPSHGTLTSIVTNGAFVYEPEPGFVGTDGFTYTLLDARGAFSGPTAVTILVTTGDVTPPVITPADSVITLWPPNHKVHEFLVSDLVAAVTDEGQPGLSVEDVAITRVTCDEPDDATGDGHTVGDMSIGPRCDSVALRAERQGDGNGRVYAVDLAVEDDGGNIAVVTVKIRVPLAPDQAVVEDAPVRAVYGGCGPGAPMLLSLVPARPGS